MIPVTIALGLLCVALGVLVIIQMKKIQDTEQRIHEIIEAMDYSISVQKAKADHWQNEYVKLSLNVSNKVKNGDRT